jgi:hypothetical protein
LRPTTPNGAAGLRRSLPICLGLARRYSEGGARLLFGRDIFAGRDPRHDYLGPMSAALAVKAPARADQA